MIKTFLALSLTLFLFNLALLNDTVSALDSSKTSTGEATPVRPTTIPVQKETGILKTSEPKPRTDIGKEATAEVKKGGLKESLKSKQEEVKEKLNEKKQEIEDLKASKEAELKTLKQGAKEKVGKVKADFKEKLNETKEKFQEELKLKKAETQEKMKAKREEYKKELETIKDEKKKVIVDKLDKRYSEINANRAEHQTKILERINALLEKIKSRTAKAEANGKNVTEVKTAITKAEKAISDARTAVANQVAKEYVITIIDESKLGEAVSTTKNNLVNDLKTSHKTVLAAKDAVVSVLKTLAKVKGVDEVE